MRQLNHALLIVFSLVLFASAADAACPRVPDNSVWGQVGAGALARYVEQAHKGDWTPYIQKWEARLAKIEDMQSRGATLVFHNSDQWLSGEKLARYVDDVRTRVAATRCLAALNDQQKTPGEAVAGSPLGGGS